MNRVDRLMGMLTVLQSKKYVPAETLAEKFNISIRTVYRDVKALNEIGVPVSFEANRGYCIMPGYFLPPVSFTAEEANALVLMESLTIAFADHSIATCYRSALEKVKSVLRHTSKEAANTLQSQIIMMPEYVYADKNYLSDIQTAITQQHTLHITYEDVRGNTTTRSVEPIGLMFYSHWHLIAWCRKRAAYRDFKVSRIVSLKDACEPFREKHISMDEYFSSISEAMQNGLP